MAFPALDDLRSINDLPRLAIDLGFEARWHELSLGTIDRTLPDATPAAVIGRKANSILLGLETADAERLARSLGALLDRRGAVALIAALDPVRRRLTLASTAADRVTATIALDRIRPVDRRILERGRDAAGDSPVRHAMAWAEALSGRSLDRRFFAQFRATLDQAIDGLPRRIPRRDRHALALLDLTRILFLYFVQERGWLDGRARFLREELERVGGSGLTGKLFRPLFFGTLNTPAKARSAAARRFGRVPFLNGGLFEPRPIERRHRVALPDPVWRDAFDQLFDRYHFTIAPDGEGDAIGPDMLGRVFEGVMESDERRDTGAFFTPSELVDRIVTEALRAWLARRGVVAAGDEALARPDSQTLDEIRRIRVLDPAVGSGAFLVGALHRLVAIRRAAGEEAGAATRAVVAGNLFGVDLNPSAVHLTELRLWLEVIQADPAADPESVAPLPNLDALIRQGDSVLERIDLPIVLGERQAAAIATRRRRVIAASGPRKQTAIRDLRRAELGAARSAVTDAIARVERRIAELLSAARAPGLFGGRGPLGAAARRDLESLRKQRAGLRGLARRLRDMESLPWFHYPSQFAEVMAGGGFDLVLTNPPWVRAESLTAEQRAGLKARYRWFAAAGGRPGFHPLPDLAVAFLERAFELVRPGGVVAGVFPAKILTAQWGAATRAELARRTTVELAADLSGSRHGFDATVYPLALVAAAAPPAGDHHVRHGFETGAPETSQASLGGDPWIRGPRADGGAATVGDRFRIQLGLKTGADDVFLDPGGPVEDSLLRGALRGRDVRAFSVAPGPRLLWTHDERGAPLPALPPLAARWIARHDARLRRRADFRAGPPWAVFRAAAAVSPWRVVWRDLSRDLEAVALTGPRRRLIPLNTCYWIDAGSERGALAVAAWLNSGPIRALARAAATSAQSGFFRFNAGTVARLPFPPAAADDDTLIEIARAAHQGAPDQAALDRRAAALLR